MGEFVSQCLFVDHWTGTRYDGITCYHMYYRMKSSRMLDAPHFTPYVYY